MKDFTKGEIKQKVNKFEALVDRLKTVETELLEIRTEIKGETEGDFTNPVKDALGLYSAEAKSNKAVKSLGDLLGALTATIRSLTGVSSAQIGLYDGPATNTTAQKPSARPKTSGVSIPPGASKKAGSSAKKPPGKKTTAKKQTGTKKAKKA